MLLLNQCRSFDKFTSTFEAVTRLHLNPNIIFFGVTDGDWKKARKQKQSQLHILEPVDLNIIFSRAMVVTDSRMAK